MLAIVALMFAVTTVPLRAQSPLELAEFDVRSTPEFHDTTLRNWGRALDSLGFFDSGVIGSNDRQILDYKQNGMRVTECIGTISPERHAHQNAYDDISRYSPGRITAKIEIEESLDDRPCGGHVIWDGERQVQLAPGTHYIFVYGYAQVSANSGRARARIVHKESGEGTDARISVCVHPEYGYRHALARWVHKDRDAAAWWTCVRFGCCNLGD
jgi:hypothetical protein